MLTLREIALGVLGAWRLANFDPSGMACFDRSLHGVWRSFRVAILVAPAEALLSYLDYAAAPSAGALRAALVGAIAYVVGWTAFPLAAAYVAPAIGRDAEYPGYLVAYNWATILQVALILPVDGAIALGLLPHGVADVLFLASRLVILAYAWFIARTGLRLGGAAAAGMVALDIVISLIIARAVIAMS